MKNRTQYILYKALVIAAVTLASSCKKFVDLGAPPTQVLYEDAFKTDASAQSVILGIYSNAAAATNGYITLTNFYAGVSADDIQYNGTDPLYQEFANNALTNTNGYAANIWQLSYALIKHTNNAISGLNASNTLTPARKNQLLGEAKFIRAYAYFYLTNYFGDVPLVLKDDNFVFENALLPRSSTSAVYAQIIDDLTDAQSKLSATYEGTLRGRVNKYAANALLARVYLYLKDYANAETQATLVIGSGTYSLPSPDASFINTSNEVIWQIANITGASVFGSIYITAATVVPTSTLTDATYQSFAANDLRRSNWVAPKTISGRTYNAITKYKVASGTGNEYNVALRVAEQYLIRAEARAQLNNLSGAKTDLDAVRTRAGLGGISATLTQAQTLSAIELDRKLELFGEWGHRWLDLKRTNRADAVLGALRPTTWKSTAVLFPIPQSQTLANPSLTQNPGYPQ